MRYPGTGPPPTGTHPRRSLAGAGRQLRRALLGIMASMVPRYSKWLPRIPKRARSREPPGRYWYTSMRQAEERCICSRRITNSSSLHPQLQPRNGGPGPTSPSKVSPERAPASSDLPAKVSSWSALARSDVHAKISPGRAPAKICH